MVSASLVVVTVTMAAIVLAEARSNMSTAAAMATAVRFCRHDNREG
jgi:hypothetical protein